MKLFSNSAFTAGTAALLLAASFMLSSSGSVAGSQIQPAKTKITCSKATACFEASNSSTGPAIEGVSTGDYPATTNAAVEGTASGGLSGVTGISMGTGPGGYFESGGYYASLEGVSKSSSVAPLLACGNVSGGNCFYSDAFGNGVFGGSVTAFGGFQTVMQARTGETVRASFAQTPAATMEDTGTARLLRGESAVRLDPAFASTIDPSRGYQVFLTPSGDTRGLYVSAKYEAGFFVRENEHGRSSVYFDYRVVARPLGESNARLPQSNVKWPHPLQLRQMRP